MTHPIPSPDTVHVYHQYVVQSEYRDLLEKHLSYCGVATAILYPVPVHKQFGYVNKVSIGCGGMKVTDKICERILCLPVYPELNEEALEKIIYALKTFNIGELR